MNPAFKSRGADIVLVSSVAEHDGGMSEFSAPLNTVWIAKMS